MQLVKVLHFTFFLCLLLPTVVIQAADKVDFVLDIAPIFRDHCIGCHNPDDVKGGVSLATFKDLVATGYVVAGMPHKSPLLKIVTANGANPPAMPKKGLPLSRRQVALIHRWIANGAKWPKQIILGEKLKVETSWWSLQPIVDAQPSGMFSDYEFDPPDMPVWSKHPIDQFIYAKLSDKDLWPSPPADRRTLVRRLYFDLIGLPPTLEDVESFVSDPDPLAYEKLVDRLLDSPHFGERWARHWFDISHYADTHGFERDKRRDNAYHYRDYVIRAFNQDKPYNQFLLEQIAGDVIAPEDPDAVIATGFLAAGPWDFVGQVETKSPVLRRSARALDLDDMVTQVMTATTAMTVNCARCHDHKIDPISQKEYYQLVSVFAGLRRGDRPISESALDHYRTESSRVHEEIRQVSLAIGALQGQSVDLADVVGSGSGFGTGKKGLGIDVRTGKTLEGKFGNLDNVKPGDYVECDYKFVDGVFVPTRGETEISSTGLVATGLPANGNQAWDLIRNGPVSQQFSTKLGDTDYNSEGHSMIGLHANAGITFDLAAVREALDYGELQFSAVAGYGGRLVEPSAEYWVFLDGECQAYQRIGRNDAELMEFTVANNVRFLTLISTDGGNGYGHDQICFGDPRLKPLKFREMTEEQRRRLQVLQVKKEQLVTKLESLRTPPEFYGVVSNHPEDVHVLNRGNPEDPTVKVVPGTLSWGGSSSLFGSNEMPEGARRVALANWIIDPENPLTRRVIVNRLWHWHFGQGIVTTPSDFGLGGARPSHPELLDWLSTELLRSEWSLKHIHRLIVTSKTYKMRSNVEVHGQDETKVNPIAVDVDNRLLWRMNPRRLEAEAVRDSALAVSGKLNSQMFGPGYCDFDYQEAYAPVYTYKITDSPEFWRRSVYRFIVRSTPQKFMTALDCPDPASLTPKRNVTTTVLQSLALFNNEFMLQQSSHFAERVKNESGSDLTSQVQTAFHLAFGRSAQSEELKFSQQLLKKHNLLHLCRVLLNTNEFVHID